MAALVLPDVTFKDSFLAAMAEFAAEGRTGDGSGIGRDLEEWTGRWETNAGFAAYVAQRVGERDRV